MGRDRIVILGSKDLAIQIYSYLIEANIEVVGFLDDFKNIGERIIEDVEVIGGFKDISRLFYLEVFSSVVLGIGYNYLSKKTRLFNELDDMNISISGFIHSTCYINKHSQIHKSSILYPNCIIDQRVVIERNVIVNLNSVISHDTKIGENTFIAPGVVISGHCSIGLNCFIGSGSVIRDKITICDNVVLGIGSVVVNDLLYEGVYFGNPAKLKK
jgi:sugar O-acyltransferase (sialic acid O-acetyltransferase NeuD family)